MTARILPYVVPFLGALALTLVLTPVVREVNRRLGMVDRPGGRRINRTPVPRGGGVALFLGIAVSYSLFILISGCRPFGPVPPVVFWRLLILAALSTAIGLADDKWSLPPFAKLAGQMAVGLLVWLWAGLGFSDLWPSIPAPVDCVLTVFWVVGAMNAFNLIDGLDGLASGLALIAVVGMAGGLFFVRCTAQVTFYAAVAGGLLGFLRYNYNPASVFLGDSGSMLIGYIIAVLPLCSHVQNSLLVSVGVPLLAMGVPIFDTSLAILRRALRRMLDSNPVSRRMAGVATADSDHIHHRTGNFRIPQVDGNIQSLMSADDGHVRVHYQRVGKTELLNGVLDLLVFLVSRLQLFAGIVFRRLQHRNREDFQFSGFLHSLPP